eukprot:s1989_g11.t1
MRTKNLALTLVEPFLVIVPVPSTEHRLNCRKKVHGCPLSQLSSGGATLDLIKSFQLDRNSIGQLSAAESEKGNAGGNATYA